MRALTGLAQTVLGAEVRGYVELCSRRIDEMSNDEIQRRIQIVNQDPYTHFLEPIPIDDLIGYAEKFYGDKAEEVVHKIIKALDIGSFVEKPLTHLSAGQLRKVAIAKALIPNPKVIAFDEPLMWLDDNSIQMFKEVMSAVKKMGKTVVVVEHRFHHLTQFADSIYILHRGKLEKMLKSGVEAIEKSGFVDTCRLGSGASNCGENCKSVVLEARDVWFKYVDSPWILKSVNLRICRGDTVVIYGANGAGKSTLLRVLAGVLKPVKGYVKRYSDMLYVPQIPHLFITEDSIYEEVRALCRSRGRGSECISKAIENLKRFGYNNLDSFPFNMSWGQITRLVTILACSIAREGIVLLDEPFTGSTYLEAIQLIDTLNSFSDVAKVITLSSRDYLPLFAHAKIYMLIDGTLKDVVCGGIDVNSFAKAVSVLYS